MYIDLQKTRSASSHKTNFVDGRRHKRETTVLCTSFDYTYSQKKQTKTENKNIHRQAKEKKNTYERSMSIKVNVG